MDDRYKELIIVKLNKEIEDCDKQAQTLLAKRTCLVSVREMVSEVFRMPVDDNGDDIPF